jgi:hypothetical protein
MTEDALSLRSPRLVFAALQPVVGRPLRGPLLGPGYAVAELRTPWPWCIYDFFGCCPLVVTGFSFASVVGRGYPGEAGMAVAVAGRLVRDGFEGLAACHPAMTRPLIERDAT